MIKSQGTKEIVFFSQGTNDSKNLKCENLHVVSYEVVNISSFAALDVKL